MLTLDLREPDEKLVALIAEVCRKYGSVRSVKMRRSQSPLALVEMATREEALELALNHAGAVVGAVTMIHLSPQITPR